MSIRTLCKGEPLPDGEPRRYPNYRGYIRLRWHVGPNEYVEVYEHRLVAGLPDGEVHHLNGVRDDNQPGNLQPLSKTEHAHLHGEAAHANWQWGPFRSRAEMESAQRAEQNRQSRARETAEMASLYRSGLSTTQVGVRMGIDSSNVSRRLRAAGVEMRPRSRAPYMRAIDESTVRAMHADGIRAKEMARRLRVSDKRIGLLLDQLGLRRFNPGNPALVKAGAA